MCAPTCHYCAGLYWVRPHGGAKYDGRDGTDPANRPLVALTVARFYRLMPYEHCGTDEPKTGL